ncbi:MAG TPA: HAD hydrolase-like protein, partial [Lachnospiraceae bacterium]
EKENVIMVGDAKGDMEAAYANGVHFYPILVGKEKESWESLNSVLKRVMTKSFDDDMQKMLEKKFYENLGG